MLRRSVLFLLDVVLKIGTRLIRGAASLMRCVCRRQIGSERLTRIWIDVGAHRGETTFNHARDCPDLMVYAFEPDVSVASHRFSLLPNFVVLPMAVTETDGFREFVINSNSRTSSLLPLSEVGLKKWRGAGGLRTLRKAVVPTIRLDTFMEELCIKSVEYLKVDAQGHDLEVVRSLGQRIGDVSEIRLEACATDDPMYIGAHNCMESVIDFMKANGFDVVESLPESLGQERNLVFRATRSDLATVMLENSQRQ
jgi:FkbM family methyltransferase